jgi:hypothetical protein
VSRQRQRHRARAVTGLLQNQARSCRRRVDATRCGI